jgi:hypothetical protein
VALAAAYSIGKLVPAAEHCAFVVALLVGLVPIARRAVVAALAGTPFSIETHIPIAVGGGVLVGAKEEAATVILPLLVGELLEGGGSRTHRGEHPEPHQSRAQDRARGKGRRHRGGSGRIAVGDLVVVRPRDRIPADTAILHWRVEDVSRMVRLSFAYHVPTKGYPVPRCCDIFEPMERSLMISRLLLALALLGLVLGPVGASSAAPTMAAQTIVSTADGMACCPDHQPAIPDCGQDCPLTVLCVPVLPGISVAEASPFLTRMPIRDELREGRKTALASLIGEPPPRPPKA